MHCIYSLPRVATAFCIAALLAAGPASAQEREMVPLRILESLHMDGVLDEDTWQNALAASGFTQQRPDEGRPATERTEVRVLYDEETLYIGLWAYDSDPSQIIATQMQRDGDLADDDYFQIILDTYLDRQNGILFATNPDGARYDAQLRNEGRSEGRFNTNVLTDWNGVWDVYTSRTEEGWFRRDGHTLEHPALRVRRGRGLRHKPGTSGQATETTVLLGAGHPAIQYFPGVCRGYA